MVTLIPPSSASAKHGNSTPFGVLFLCYAVAVGALDVPRKKSKGTDDPSPTAHIKIQVWRRRDEGIEAESLPLEGKVAERSEVG